MGIRREGGREVDVIEMLLLYRIEERRGEERRGEERRKRRERDGRSGNAKTRQERSDLR
jgi:hypothetical protein